MAKLTSRIDTDTPSGKSRDERDLLEYSKSLWLEGRESREGFRKHSDIVLDRKTYRGKLRPKGHVEADRIFSLNIVQAFIDRMVAQLTDNRPIIRIESVNPSLAGMSDVLEKYIRSVIWEESRAQRQLFRIAHTAAIEGAAGACVSYSNVSGTIQVEMLHQEQISLHRGVVEAAMIDDAEYICIRRDVPLSWLRQRFPHRGSAVKADVTADKTASNTEVESPHESFFGGSKKSSDTIEMAAFYDLSIIDRETRVRGDLAFPQRRRILFTQDVLLDDGPNPYGDGLAPVDVFDWGVDPEHPWGMSAAEMMRLAQVAFNDIMDGNIQNQITLNMMNLIQDQNALDTKSLTRMRKLKGINILSKRRNSTVSLQSPPSFGQDKIALAREIFSYLQAIMGVSGLTLEGGTGSLQSGQALEGLQEGGNLMTRSRASRLEDFMARIGQKITARIIQFVPPEKVIEFLGETEETAAYATGRTSFFVGGGKPLTLQQKATKFRLLRFAIEPGSSAPGSKQARAQSMLGLHLLPQPLVSGKAVLEAAEIRNPERMIQEARGEMPLPDPEGKGVSPGLLQQTPQIFAGKG